MPARRHQPFISLVALLRTHEPPLDEPERAISERRVLVDGRVVDNPRAQVRRGASVRVLAPRQLRGDDKLSAALDHFGLDVTGAVGLDVGAAAGGFTSALLRRGASRVYAVDVGFGQLTGTLRADPRVINLERTNVASLDRRTVPEPVDLVTVDVSYTPLTAVVGHLGAVELSPAARLVALVKPTFELQASALVTDGPAVRRAIELAAAVIGAHGWTCRAATLPAVTGRGGAVEAFVLAGRAER